MITKFAGRCAAVALAIALMALPASAQKNVNDLSKAQQDELYCVYNTVSDGDDYDLVVEAYLYSDQKAEDAKKALADLRG